jgi:hypothetical protein
VNTETKESTVARSISQPVRERLQRLEEGRFASRVLAVFDRACDLVTDDGDVVALVVPRVGDGPLNVVVNGTAGHFAGIVPGTRVSLEKGRLWVGELAVDLTSAAVWDPRPDWDALRGRRGVIAPQIPLLRALCLREAPTGSLLALFTDTLPDDTPTRVVLSTAQKAARALQAGRAGDLERLREGTARLAGLGSGLTPAGDDFLTGAMLRVWLDHPTPRALCSAMVEVAAPRTTTLAAAFLRVAARGECNAPWHGLLAALSEGVEAAITAAVQEVLTHGATSGADALAGFLYLA